MALAAVLGLTATAVATIVAASAKSAVTAFEWSVYERPLSALPAKSPTHIVVVRDPASEARFGAGAWDRAVLADAVSALSRSGAAVIAVDTPLGQPSAPGRGGPSSDALLMMLLGGQNALFGPLLGAAVFTWLQDALARWTEYWRACVGIGILLIVMLFPHGIGGVLDRWPWPRPK